MSSRLPAIAVEAEAWWQATKEKRLLVQHCVACDSYQHYPRALCLACASVDLHFVEAVGTGTVHSYTIVHRSPDPAVFNPPYIVAVVELDEGPRLLTNIIEADDLACDVPVMLDWELLDDDRHLPVFRIPTMEA